MSGDWKVLVPVAVLEGESVPDAVIELLATLPVTVLGYHVLPEQTPPDQARAQFEDAAQAKLEDLAAAFREAGGAAETRLVFTHDAEQTLDRVAAETGCDAILIPNPVTEVERLLVPVNEAVNVDRLAGFLAALRGARAIELALVHVAESQDAVPAGDALVERVSTALRDRGVPASLLDAAVVVDDARVDAIVEASRARDAIVMGESEPSLRSFLFGELPELVAGRTLGPVIAVRRPAEAPSDPP